jgi:hypothetical protein
LPVLDVRGAGQLTVQVLFSIFFSMIVFCLKVLLATGTGLVMTALL